MAHQFCSKNVCVIACNTGATLNAAGTLCVLKTTTAITTTKAAAATTTTRPPTTTTRATTTTKPATTTTPAPVCDATIAATSVIRGTGTLPKPTAFVTKASTSQQLMVGGKVYRPVGVNIYWLCQDENVLPVGAPTDKGRIREALAIAVAMGSNTIRLISCSASVGDQNPYSLMLQRGVINQAAWDIRDYALFAAREYGLRVILPLSDNYNYCKFQFCDRMSTKQVGLLTAVDVYVDHGGKYQFLNWRGAWTGLGGQQFYYDPNVINDFKYYITQILTHVNPYTGKTWARDPTVLAWESGNEFGAWMGKEGYPPASFTQNILSLVKQYSSSLTIDGSDGFYNYTSILLSKETSPGLNVAAVDIMSDHSYGRNIGIMNIEKSLTANSKKNFLIGEFDWTSNKGGDSLASYLSSIEQTTYMGDIMWSVQGRDAMCCKFVKHEDGYSAYPQSPSLNSAADRSNLLLLSQHFYRLTGRAAPSSLVGVACPQPAF